MSNNTETRKERIQRVKAYAKEHGIDTELHASYLNFLLEKAMAGEVRNYEDINRVVIDSAIKNNWGRIDLDSDWKYSGPGSDSDSDSSFTLYIETFGKHKVSFNRDGIKYLEEHDIEQPYVEYNYECSTLYPVGEEEYREWSWDATFWAYFTDDHKENFKLLLGLTYEIANEYPDFWGVQKRHETLTTEDYWGEKSWPAISEYAKLSGEYTFADFLEENQEQIEEDLELFDTYMQLDL